MNCEVEGLEIVGGSEPFGGLDGFQCESVDYKTPNGTVFSLAKDAIGIHFCLEGIFWPSSQSFPSMEEGVALLRHNTQLAILFFDEIRKRMNAQTNGT
jgi:hypothetical protein